MTKQARLVIITAQLFALVVPPSLLAQSPEKKARVSYAAAKIALEQGDTETALAKFEEVIGVLGPLPELLYYAGEAAFQGKKPDKAKEYADRAFKIDDKEFEKTPEFQKLVALEARLDLRSGDGGTWEQILEALPKGYLETSTELNVKTVQQFEIGTDRQAFIRRMWTINSENECGTVIVQTTSYRRVGGQLVSNWKRVFYHRGNCGQVQSGTWVPIPKYEGHGTERIELSGRTAQSLFNWTDWAASFEPTDVPR